MNQTTYLAIIGGVVMISITVLIVSIWVPGMLDVAKVSIGTAIGGILGLFVKAPGQ